MSEPTTPLASDEMDASYDVVVVGGGGSGLSAAVQAARNGLSVALIEKMPVLGGCSAFAEGHAAFGSDEQAKRGINVTKQDGFDALLDWGLWLRPTRPWSPATSTTPTRPSRSCATWASSTRRSRWSPSTRRTRSTPGTSPRGRSPG